MPPMPLDVPHDGTRSRTRHALAAVAMLVAAYSLAAPAPAGALNEKLVPAEGVLLGAMAPDVPRFQRLIRHRIAIEHSFYDWRANFPGDHERWTVRHGRIPMITWMPSTDLDGILSGRFDDRIRARARASREFGRRYFLRFAHEMNGNWYPWDGAHNGRLPASYVAAWRHVHDIFDAVGATKVVWVWSPHWRSFPSESWNDFRNYYPGNRYVDWVAIDGYNHGSIGDWNWMSFRRLFRAVYGAYADKKPIMIAETASVDQGGSKAEWIRSVRRLVRDRFRKVKAFVWFHMVASYEGHTFDWRVNSSRSALRAFRRMARDPYFGAHR